MNVIESDTDLSAAADGGIALSSPHTAWLNTLHQHFSAQGFAEIYNGSRFYDIYRYIKGDLLEQCGKK